MNFSEEQTQLPSLWRVKAKSYFWTLLFFSVFFTVFYSLRSHINLDLGGLMQPQDARMSVVWLLTIFCSLAFNKIYFMLNSEVFQSNTQMLRLINKKVDDIPRLQRQINEIKDFLVTYADKLPSTEEFPELPAEVLG